MSHKDTALFHKNKYPDPIKLKDLKIVPSNYNHVSLKQIPEKDCVVKYQFLHLKHIPLTDTIFFSSQIVIELVLLIYVFKQHKDTDMITKG